jgi:hypothetical protein
MDGAAPPIGGKPAKLARFARLGPRRLALLVEAVTALVIARLIVATRPPARVARRFGQPLADGVETQGAAHRARDAECAADIGWAIRCAAANVPFRALCVEQALAARTLLDRRAIEAIVHYGIAPPAGDSDGMRAHVWVSAAGEEISGYPLRPAFRDVARFGSRRLKDFRRDGR